MLQRFKDLKRIFEQNESSLRDYNNNIIELLQQYNIISLSLVPLLIQYTEEVLETRKHENIKIETPLGNNTITIERPWRYIT